MRAVLVGIGSWKMDISDTEDFYCDLALSQFEMDSDQSTLSAPEVDEEIIFGELEQKRFAEPVTDEELESLSEKRIPPNTRRNMRWSINAFESWRRARNRMCTARVSPEIYEKYHVSTIKIELMSDEQYNKIVSKFIMESRKQNGDRYPASSLFQLLASIQGYIRMKGNNVSFIKDPKFKPIQDALDDQMKISTKVFAALNQNAPKQADIVERDTEEKLWDEAILGSDNAEQLLYTLMYLLGYSFALRASEHKALKINEQISIQIDEQGREYLQYYETTSKGYDGGLKSMKRLPRCSCAYANVENPMRCPVELYRKYISLCPVERRPADLYLQPLNLNQRKSHLWYARRPVGIHKIEGFLRNMTNKLNIPGKFTPHSLRATNASRLYHHGLEEQLIQEQTGHSSLAVRKYKRTCSDQKLMVSKILQNPCKKLASNPFKQNANGDSEDEFQDSQKCPFAKNAKASATISKPPSTVLEPRHETIPLVLNPRPTIASLVSVDNSNRSSLRTLHLPTSSEDLSTMSRPENQIVQDSNNLPFYGPQPNPNNSSSMSRFRSGLDVPMNIQDLSNNEVLDLRSHLNREIRGNPINPIPTPSTSRRTDTPEIPREPDVNLNVDALNKTVSIQIRFQ